MSFQLVPKSVPPYGIMAIILRYFTKFGKLRGPLRKIGCR